MTRTLLSASRQFEFPSKADEIHEDDSVFELYSGYRAYYSPQPVRAYRVDTEAERHFVELAEEWREDTAFTSALTDIILHPAYQRIIGMGPESIPLILRELQSNPEQWFWALRALTGEDPVDAEDAGRVRKMAEAWLDWGRRQGYI